ncbi:hypothetical protein MAR_000510 [Mya arenaria]|uniref:Uncharacterized protein n=1 Tax=Mya arenaria TaxID=6604 RepID=A0ABY7FCA7_MYAAR|nr:hypothetical protein MAR_000510 [Mya arenaria]
MDHTTSSGPPHVTIKKVKLDNMNSMPTEVSMPDDHWDVDLLSPEGRNKRKRYMPLHSPLQTITNQEKSGTWECLQPSHFLDHLVGMPHPAYNVPASSCPVMPASTATSSTGLKLIIILHLLS